MSTDQKPAVSKSTPFRMLATVGVAMGFVGGLAINIASDSTLSSAKNFAFKGSTQAKAEVALATAYTTSEAEQPLKYAPLPFED
ncbi:hypothetical protein BH09PSE5_BH09PSE5_13750 [soil metagenome]